jgi:hypothetical protein
LRRNALEAPPKSVAEARAQARTNLDRAEVLAQRKARKERERQSSRRTPSGPPKYKRRRIETSNGVGIIEAETDESTYEEDEALGYEHESEPIDPLDAQNLGLHDAAYDLGHEEIRLNLGDEPEEPDGDPPRETPHPN